MTGEQLRAMRKRMGMSREAFCAECRRVVGGGGRYPSASAVAKWEVGRVRVTEGAAAYFEKAVPRGVWVWGMKGEGER